MISAAYSTSAPVASIAGASWVPPLEEIPSLLLLHVGVVNIFGASTMRLNSTIRVTLSRAVKFYLYNG